MKALKPFGVLKDILLGLFLFVCFLTVRIYCMEIIPFNSIAVLKFSLFKVLRYPGVSGIILVLKIQGKIRFISNRFNPSKMSVFQSKVSS